MKNRFDVNAIINDLKCYDLAWVCSKKNNKIEYTPLLEDKFLSFKINKTYLSLVSGFQLTKAEKKLKWFYQNYDTSLDLAADLVKFAEKYNKSFHLTRKHK